MTFDIGYTPWNKGKRLSNETKNKIRQSCIGINKGPKSEKTKAKISQTKRGCIGHNKGIKFDDKWKINLSKAHIGQIPWNKKNYIIKHKRVLKTGLELLEKKRFRNQRYKANKKYANGKHTFNEWLELKTKYQNMCLCCKKQEPEIKLTEDHIIPLSMGGSDNIDNIQPLCVSCNTRKHTKSTNYKYTHNTCGYYAN